MFKNFREISRKVLTGVFVIIFIPLEVYCIDYGEWITKGSGLANAENVRRWCAVRVSSEAYRVKSGITSGAKPDGNIIVAEIKKILPDDKRQVVIRSSMYPFGQINRAYDSIDLADILLGAEVSSDLKTRVFLYNKLCALEVALSSVIRAKQLDKKEEKIQIVLDIKQDLMLYRTKIENVDVSLVNAIDALSHEKLQVPLLGVKIKNLRATVMPMLKNYIARLSDYFSEIHRIIGNSITLKNGIGELNIPISIVAQERVREILAMCGDERTYDRVNTELKNTARFKDNAHRLVHSEDILLYYIRRNFPNYQPVLICTYLNMCQDCEQVVSTFANAMDEKEVIIVISESEIPGEKGARRNSPDSLVKKILIPKAI